jgi:hypothetical protein
MRKVFPGCCALAEPQTAKSMAQSAMQNMFFRTDLPIQNPKPVLSHAEGSKIQNGVTESLDLL